MVFTNLLPGLIINYGDILYDKLGNQNFKNKLEKVWYKAFLAITMVQQVIQTILIKSLKSTGCFDKPLIFEQ